MPSPLDDIAEIFGGIFSPNCSSPGCEQKTEFHVTDVLDQRVGLCSVHYIQNHKSVKPVKGVSQ